MTYKINLSFGYHVYDQKAPAAWGARMIQTGIGDLDYLHDRQDFYAADDDSRQELIRRLNDGGLELIRLSYKDAYMRNEVSSRESNEVILVDTDKLQAIGNTNGSGGYFYISAWIPSSPTLHLRELIHQADNN